MKMVEEQELRAETNPGTDDLGAPGKFLEGQFHFHVENASAFSTRKPK